MFFYLGIDYAAGRHELTAEIISKQWKVMIKRRKVSPSGKMHDQAAKPRAEQREYQTPREMPSGNGNQPSLCEEPNM